MGLYKCKAIIIWFCFTNALICLTVNTNLQNGKHWKYNLLILNYLFTVNPEIFWKRNLVFLVWMNAATFCIKIFYRFSKY